MQLRELDADRRLAVAKRVERGLERCGNAERRLVADERVLLVRIFSEPVAERARSARRKTAEGKGRRGESAHQQRDVDGACAGDDLIGNSLLRAGADDAVAGIGNRGISSVRTERHLLARPHVRDNPLGDALLVALAVGEHVGGTGNPEMRQQLPGAPSVLARDDRRGLERLQRPRRKIAEIPDWSGDDV